MERETRTRRHYHPIGIFFHWLMAAEIAFQLWWGWRMNALWPGYDKLDAYVVHAQIGAAIFLTAFLRLGWRIIDHFISPPLEKPEDMPGWQHAAAEMVHALLYVLMFALPLSGLAIIASTAPETLERALGVTAFQTLSFETRAAIEHWAEWAHFLFVWGIMGLIAVHAGAALKHHFIDRDDVLVRMAPILKRRPEEDDAARSPSTANAAR